MSTMSFPKPQLRRMSGEYTAIRVHFNLRDVKGDCKSQCSQRLAGVSPQRCWALSGIAPGEMVSKSNDAFGLRLLLLGDLCRLRSSYSCMISLFYMCFLKELIGVLSFGVEMRLLLPFSIKALAYPGVFPFSLTPVPDPHPTLFCFLIFSFIWLQSLIEKIDHIGKRDIRGGGWVTH